MPVSNEITAGSKQVSVTLLTNCVYSATRLTAEQVTTKTKSTGGPATVSTNESKVEQMEITNFNDLLH